MGNTKTAFQPSGKVVQRVTALSATSIKDLRDQINRRVEAREYDTNYGIQRFVFMSNIVEEQVDGKSKFSCILVFNRWPNENDSKPKK
jgi:hypothetical protein